MKKNEEDARKKESIRMSGRKEEKNKETASALKKTKMGLAKVKRSIEHTVNAKNIMKLIKQGTRLIPHLLTRQQSKVLLPKLQTIVMPKGADISICSNAKFEEIENKLTHSMVMFKKTAELQRNDQWAIDLQTQKCYKSIPSIYFEEHLNPQELAKHVDFSVRPLEIQETILNLVDFLDQVQYNINEQAKAKITMFMTFVFCTNSIQDLVNINLGKLAATRKNIGILRDIIVSRSVRINQHRLRKERVEAILEAMIIFKKLKTLESKLNAQIVLGNFIPHDPRTKLGSIFQQYCEIHNMELQKFCCKGGKNLCRYWDITYYVERGFQENFMKMIKVYLFELINTSKEIESFKKSFQAFKKNFMTTPSNSQQFSRDVNNVIMDESFQIDAFDHVELITKVHIEKEIVALFEQGMHKYSFSTEGLQKDLKDCLSGFVDTFLRETLTNIGSEPRLTLRDLNSQNENNYFETERCKQRIQKATFPYFNKMMEMVMQRFEYLSIRLLSLVEKLLTKASELQAQTPERYQVFSVYMVQLVASELSMADKYLTEMLRSRLRNNDKSITLFKSKEQIIREYDMECESMKKLVKFCNKWINLVETLQRDYTLCWKEFQKGFQSERNIYEKTDNFNDWCLNLEELKGFLVKSNFELLHKTIVTRDLRETLEDERWQFVEIKAHIYNDLGYILGGKQFLIEEERSQRDSLSKSLLMDKSQIEVEPVQQIYRKEEYSSRFKINPSYITLEKQKIKLTSSTEHMIQFLRRYLELYDDVNSEAEKKRADLQGKLTELILMYNQYIKDLILKGEAVNLGKMKSKSITAKHLVISYIQLKAVELLFTSQIIEKRVGLNRDECSLMRDKIMVTQTEICKKYQRIIELRIKDSIESINYKDELSMQSQPLQQIAKNMESSIHLFSELMLDEKQYSKFIDMDPNWVSDLANKVGKGPKAKENKIKCFSSLIDEFKPFSKYLPRLMIAIKSILN